MRLGLFVDMRPGALYAVLLQRHTNDKLKEHFDTANYLRIGAIGEGGQGSRRRADGRGIYRRQSDTRCRKAPSAAAPAGGGALVVFLKQ